MEKANRASSSGTSNNNAFSTIKEKVFSVFGLQNKNIDSYSNSKKIKNNNVNLDLTNDFDTLPNNGFSTPANLSMNTSFQESQGPITARQLKDYYDSLRRENNELTEKLINDSKETANKSSSSNKEKDISKISDRSGVKDNQLENNLVDRIDDQENKIVLYNDESDIDMGDYGNEDSILGIFPTYTPPDPLERANLVQLKKMMELEKYRKYRLSYLREHTRHLNKGKVDKYHFKNMRKKLNLKELPENRRNKSGMFSISLLDTADDDDLEEGLVKPLKNNIADKLKFKSSSNDSVNKDIDMMLKPKSFKPEPKPDTKSNDLKVDPSVPSTTTFSVPKITKENKADTSIDEKPSMGFSFGKPASEKVSTTNDKPPFSFGNSTPKLPTGTNTPILETVVDKDAIDDPKMQIKSKFAFNPPGNSEAKLPLFDTSKSKSEDKPQFSFGSNATPIILSTEKKNSNFEFKPPTTVESNKIDAVVSTPTFAEPTSNATKPSPNLGKFNFGSKPDDKQEKNKPAVVFGEKPSTDNKPVFSLNTDLNSSTDKTPSSNNKPLFGASVNSTAESKTTPAFSFGAAPSAKTATPLFGTVSKDTSDTTTLEKPASLFSSSASKISLNKTATDAAEAKPAFSFNNKNANFGSVSTPKLEDTVKPSHSSNFSFGSNNTVPTLNFGAKPDEKPKAPIFGAAASNTNVSTTNDLAKPTSSFNFGTNNTAPTLNSGNTSVDEEESRKKRPAPSLSGFKFGGASAPSVPSSFGATFGSSNITNNDSPNISTNVAVNSNSKPAASGFSFGATTSSANPAAIFGASNTTSTNNNTGTSSGAPKSSFTFGSGTTNTNPANIFGNTANTSATPNNSAPSNSNAGNKLFSFSSNTFPSLDQAPKMNSTPTHTPTPSFKFNTGTTGFGTNEANNNNVMGMNNAGNGFGSNSAFGGFNAANNGNANNLPGSQNNASSAFNFGGSNGSAPNSVANSRSSTPGFSFPATNGGAGMQQPQMSAGAQAAVMNRRKAYPRSMRNRR